MKVELMFLKPMSEKMLRQWVSRDTWHEAHVNDTQFFYRFIHAYVSEHGYALDEELLQDKILFMLNRSEDQYFQTLASERVRFMSGLLEYLKYTQNLQS
ncbi:hypothetical protein ACK3Z1_00860 [Aeromonas caviae]|uniref:hypothetical protein n=1 Tax=Aeromonas caviae TaxID=648 RepID=UPI002B46DE61|nr:hypothetical protein [Aeromonas caviae]